MRTFEQIHESITRNYMLISRANRFVEWMKEHSKVEFTNHSEIYWSGVAMQYHKGRSVKAELNRQKDVIMERYDLTPEDIIAFLKGQK